jgi:hypothetical protein
MLWLLYDSTARMYREQDYGISIPLYETEVAGHHEAQDMT